MSNNKYTCGMCGGTFQKGQSDEEASKEYVENFGEVTATHDEGVVVCGDCYEKIHPRKFPELVEKTKEYFINQHKN